MIVCMNIGTDGKRRIAKVYYFEASSNADVMQDARAMSKMYDEVYVIGFNNNYEDFINEVVLKGCRI